MLVILKSISKKEWRFVAFIILAVIFITNIHLVYGFLTAPDGYSMTGIQFSIPGDIPVYYSYIEQVRQGNFLLANLSTIENQIPVFNIFWLTVGLIAKIFSLSNVAVFNLARIVLASVLLVLVYIFVAYIFSKVKNRKLAFVLLIFSSGWGFFLLDRLVRFPSSGQLNWPMDLWVPELTIFSSIYYSPHFIASWFFLLAVFLFTLLFVRSYNFVYSALAGLSALLLFAFHPFHVWTIFLVIAVYFLILFYWFKKNIWRLAGHYLILLLFSLPAILYYLFLLRNDWVIAVRNSQNICPTTPLWLTGFSLGIFLPLALLAVYFLVRDKKLDEKNIFFIVWLAVQNFLIYLPVPYQRRLAEGLYFPLIILSVIAILYLFRNWKFKEIISSQFILVFFLLFFGSAIFVVVVNWFVLTGGFLAYLPGSQTAAMEWLKESMDSESAVFAHPTMSNLITAYSGRRVYVGHGVETPFYRSKIQEVKWFFRQNRDGEMEKDFLLKRNVSYIFYSDFERELGEFNPGEKDYLEEVYSNSQVQVYRVISF